MADPGLSITGSPSVSGPGPGRNADAVARERAEARADFHRAASGSSGAEASKAPGRSAALQAFFVANAGRGLMPSGETSGVLSPTLKTEDS